MAMILSDTFVNLEYLKLVKDARVSPVEFQEKTGWNEEEAIKSNVTVKKVFYIFTFTLVIQKIPVGHG